MLFLTHFTIAIIALLAIIYTCSLFTNAIEHLGCRLKIGNSATGSILAVIGTGLPETIVPLIAIFGAILFNKDIEIGQEIALGAIIGSPFMLSTFALFLLGITIIFQKRTKLELNLNCSDILRDYKYFLIAYCFAILVSFLPNKSFKLCAVIFLLSLYGIFVYRTIDKSKQNLCTNITEKLMFFNVLKIKNVLVCIYLQLIISILLLAISVHYFLVEIMYFSNLLKISPMILSLFITPIATELPECVNSIIWLKENKDDLALNNVVGAIVFQAMVPFSIGIILTPWILNFNILLNAILVVLTSLFFISSILIYKKIKLMPLLLAGLFYFGYLFFVLNN